MSTEFNAPAIFLFDATAIFLRYLVNSASTNKRKRTWHIAIILFYLIFTEIDMKLYIIIYIFIKVDTRDHSSSM